MNASDKDDVSERTLDQLLAPILQVAQPNLLGRDPDLGCVPDRLRKGLTTVHDTLRAEVRALIELRSGYGDLMVCRVAALQPLGEGGQLTPYQHLKLVWSHFLRVRATFARNLDDARHHHREALDLFALDVEPICAAQPMSSGEDDRRWSRVDRWYQGVPEHQDAIAEMRVASQWPESLAVSDLDAARDDLRWAIDAEIDAVGPPTADVLMAQGSELVDMVERYNDMVWNFRILQRHRRD